MAFPVGAALAGGGLLASLLLPALFTGVHYERIPDYEHDHDAAALEEFHVGARLAFGVGADAGDPGR